MLGHRDTGQLGAHWRAVVLGGHTRRAFTAQERSSKGFGGVLGPGTMGGRPALGSWLGSTLCSGRHVRVVLGPHVCLCVRDVSATEMQRRESGSCAQVGGPSVAGTGRQRWAARERPEGWEGPRHLPAPRPQPACGHAPVSERSSLCPLPWCRSLCPPSARDEAASGSDRPGLPVAASGGTPSADSGGRLLPAYSRPRPQR